MGKRVVTEAEYEGWVFWEDHGPNNGYFGSCAELREWCVMRGLAPPPRVTACDRCGLSLDAADVLRNELDAQNADDGACERIDDHAVAALQAYLDVWCDEHGPEWWECDPDTEVEIDMAAYWRAKTERAAVAIADALVDARRDEG